MFIYLLLNCPDFGEAYNRLFNNRSVQNVNKNLLLEISSNPEEVALVSDFITDIYISSRNNIDVTTYYNKIATSNATNREIVNQKLVKLKDENNFSLTSMFDTILSDTTYSEHTFILLDHCFRFKQEDNYVLTPDKFESKITEMASLIFNQSEHAEEIKIFLENLINISPIKETLETIIMDKNKEEILLLSSKLLKLAFDKITTGEDIFKYEDNQEILLAIAESGNKTHIIKLSKVIISKLLKQETYQDAFEIIEVTNGFNKRDAKSIISQLENLLSDDNYKEDAKTLINNIKSKS